MNKKTQGQQKTITRNANPYTESIYPTPMSFRFVLSDRRSQIYLSTVMYSESGRNTL